MSEAVGLGTTFVIGGAMAPYLDGNSLGLVLLTAAAAILLGTLLEGALVGLAQEWALRFALPELRRGRWLGATTIGAAIAWTIGMRPSTIMSLRMSSAAAPGGEPPAWLQYVLGAAMGAVAGPILGAAQWTVLRAHRAHAVRWLWANSVAWAIGMPIIFAGMDYVPWDGSLMSRAAAIYVVCALTGVAVGLVHGFVLERLLFAPSPRLQSSI
jgi:hypothetical protein